MVCSECLNMRETGYKPSSPVTYKTCGLPTERVAYVVLSAPVLLWGLSNDWRKQCHDYLCQIQVSKFRRRLMPRNLRCRIWQCFQNFQYLWRRRPSCLSWVLLHFILYIILSSTAVFYKQYVRWVCHLKVCNVLELHFIQFMQLMISVGGGGAVQQNCTTYSPGLTCQKKVRVSVDSQFFLVWCLT